MKKMILLVLFISNNIFAEPPLCISLGSGCSPALNLRDLKLRKRAYPFDWVISPFDALYQALSDDFEFFLKDLKLRPDKTGLIDYYGFHFTHDWPTITNNHCDPLSTDFIGNNTLYPKWKNALPAVREKYFRRIERFKTVCKSKKRIFFIRKGIDRVQAIKLRDLLKNKYSQLSFVLIAVNNDPQCNTPWNLPFILNYYLEKWHDPVAWLHMLQQASPEFKSITYKRDYLLACLDGSVDHYYCRFSD